MVTKRGVQAYLVLAGIGLLAVLIVVLMARNPQPSALIVGAIVALIFPLPVILLLRKLGVPIGQAVNCERCGTEQPAVRRPTSFRQAMLGGFTCAKCGAELDTRGRLRAP